MCRETCAQLLVIFGIFWCLAPIRSEDRNENNQQTFVVRYRSGDQTIPVTVVLDFRKQTEYVINMNPRAPTKSVTLYDFKQRTIAYKDLTNRECFLGRLTHETLNEETDALSRVQNPVEHKPKILSLDPHRSSLTPTEIRNMAGQKTAVFCRKMNTWLILPQESHIVQKRDANEDGIDERTYHRHGFHTVRYSHYGHETRRRYRNSNRNSSRHLSLRNQDASDSSRPKVGNSERRLRFEGSVLPPLSPILTETSDPDALPVRELFGLNHQSSFLPPQHHDPKFEETQEEITPGFIPSLDFNSNYENHSFPLFSHHNVNKHSEYEIQPTYSSKINLFSERQNKSDDKTSTSVERDLSNSNSNVMSTLFEIPDIIPVEKSPSKIKLSISNENSSLRNEKVVEQKIYPEESFYDLEIQEPNFHSSDKSNGEPYFIDDPKQSEIESESFTKELWPRTPLKESHSSIDDEQVVTENPEVSINVLEIPKITKRFENLDQNPDTVTVPRTNEDIHDVFEGFYNLRGSYPPPRDNNFHNSYFIPSESNQRERSLPEGSIDNYPIFQHSGGELITENSLHRVENSFPFPISHEITSTDSPTLTTIITHGNKRSNNTDLNLVFETTATPSNSESDGSISKETIFQEVVPTLEAKRYGVHLKPSSFPNNRNYDKSSLNNISPTHFPTKNPAKDFKNFNHRSDIPSESDYSESIESYTPTHIESHIFDRSNQQGLSVVPTINIQEGISVHQQRFQNVLRQYKPDQIIIDVEKIPTQRPPDSTSGFQGRFFISNENPHKKPSIYPIRTINDRKSDQTAGAIFHGNPQNGINAHRRINTLQNQFPNGHKRKHISSQHHRRNESNQVPHLQQVYDIHPQGHSRKYNSVRQFNHPNPFNQPHPQLDVLPPGVSIHPRHPKAPYADMFHPNLLPSARQANNFRTLKPHRQRHHRKKDRFAHSCCKGSEKADGKVSSCCRSGGSWSSGHQERIIPSETPCCSANKNSRNVSPSQQHQMRVRYKPPQHQRRTIEDNRNRCEKEKMCRTLYESTQQVMVCRNADVEGCS